MADNKQDRGNPDRNLISFKQKYEFDYAAKQLQKQGSRYDVPRSERRAHQSGKTG